MTIYTGSIEMSSPGFGVDYIVIYYNWTDGEDLDQRTRMVSPAVSPYLGFQRPFTYLDVLIRGNDYTTTGYQSVLVYVNNFVDRYPSVDSIKFEMRAYWFEAVSNSPVKLGATAYRGGEMFLDFDIGLFRNTTYTQRWDLANYFKVVTLFNQDPSNNGQFVSYMTIDLGSLATTYSTS